ncbi:RsmD family RNA methyltransferase [Paradesertivirga mongoliensis]|uniref:RsmD family RNA methyltransferase n=1 Tax=Paradesertivirga mongoliensis TaxID=2100740 RepID=A0ABW4ZRE2_9SPHI|nr:RsmD family RNA methyltransferase [Pedobacter mongoliensis]
MRIIGGKLKGLRFFPPTNLPVRPTTDMAKEALFNILNNQLDFEGLKVLDLFSGTGNISMEFASRSAAEVVSVDINMGCIKYLKDISKKHQVDNIVPFKADVFKFLKEETETFDLIFADPPYDLPQIPLIAEIVFDRNLLKPEGVLIIEHPSHKKLDNHPNFSEQRKYGHSSFSFFRYSNNITSV